MKSLLKTSPASFAIALIGGALLLQPSTPVFAQDANSTVKAKRKGGYQPGRSPQELAEALANQAEAAAAEPSYPSIVQDYEPNPAIWKLADEDTTIYMFGTFHILPKEFRWRSDAFNAIVEEVDELVVETSDAEGMEAMGSYMATLITRMADPDVPTTSERLSEENRPKWAKIAEQTGMPLEAFDRMPLFLAMMGAGLTVTESFGSKADYGVETVLEAIFKEAGKPISSIEDAGTVMESLINMDETVLIAELDADLSKWDGGDFDDFAIQSKAFMGDDMSADKASAEGAEKEAADSASIDIFANEHSWAQGVMTEDTALSFGDSVAGKMIYQVLLTDRNRAWAEWLAQRLDSPGTILLAVGAAHFEGPDSVQIMLEERNLKVERLH